jgi:hypothetical protein
MFLSKNHLFEKAILELQNKTDYYASLSDGAKKIAPQIELLLNGLSVEDVSYMFLKIRKKILEETKVAITSLSHQ